MATTLYGSSVAATTITTACKMSSTTGGTETSKTTNAPNDSSQNYMEVLSQGGTGTDSASQAAPSGKGWLWDVTTLEGQTIAAGNWSAVITLTDTAGFTAVTFILRVYKYNSGTYTAIGTLTLTGQAMSGTKTSYSLPSSSFSAVSFTTGDKLYFDETIHPTTGHWTGDPIANFVSNSGTAGVVNDFVITAPDYSPTAVTTTYSFTDSLSGSDSLSVLNTSINAFTESLSGSDSLLKVDSYNPVESLSGSDSLNVSVVSTSILNGGFGLGGNGTGTVSFDHARFTLYPDPALSLAPVTPQTNTSEVFWSENIPSNTSRTMYTSLDGINWTDVTSQNGGSIPGIVSQGAIQTDLWTANTSSNYTSTSKTGGSVATVTYDTTNSRINLAGGSGALYLLSAVSSNKIDVLCDQDRSDAGGLVWCRVDNSNYYEVGIYDDSSSGGFTNQVRLYKVLANTRSLLGSAAISFPRSTTGTSPYHRTRVTMNAAGLINVYFDNITAAITYTDSSPLGAGLAGLRNDGGTSRYYQLRIQALGDVVTGTPAGDIVSGTFVYTKQSLSTTDPTATPQILDLTTAVRSPSVDSGVIIPQLHDPSVPFANMMNKDLDTITQASGDYHWYVDFNSYLTFNVRGAKISPWCLHSTDLLFAPGVTPASSADLYCNRVKITNVTFTVSVPNEQKIADGSATSWQMAYPLYSAPTITINSVVQSVGIQGVDSGKSYYWQSGSTSISQDANATKLVSGTILNFSYVGTYLGTVTRDNLTEQAARASVEKNSGIVEVVVDGSTLFGSGTKLTSSQAQTWGDGYLARFGNNNAVLLTCTTSSDRLGSRPAPVKGMLMPVFIPEHSLNNRQLLVTKVVTTATQKSDGNALYYYAIEATDGPNTQTWISALKGL